MGSFSIWHWIIVLIIVLVLFGGRGKLSSLMGDFGKGLKSFKKSMQEGDDEDDTAAEAPKVIKSDSAHGVGPAPDRDSATKN